MTRYHYDRTGERVDDHEPGAAQPEHDPRCRRGWLGEDDQGRVIPCLTCRPHLRPKETSDASR